MKFVLFVVCVCVATAKRQDDWYGGGGSPSTMGADRTSRVNTVQGVERTSRVNTAQAGPFSTQPAWPSAEGSRFPATQGAGQSTRKPEYTNMIDEPNQQGFQSGGAACPRTSKAAAAATVAGLWALARTARL